MAKANHWVNIKPTKTSGVGTSISLYMSAEEAQSIRDILWDSDDAYSGPAANVVEALQDELMQAGL